MPTVWTKYHGPIERNVQERERESNQRSNIQAGDHKEAARQVSAKGNAANALASEPTPARSTGMFENKGLRFIAR